MLVAALPAVWSVADRSWNFTATLDREVLHLSYGLADKRKQSIPLQRIHALRIRQPVLWRLCDWLIVEVSAARGYGTTTTCVCSAARTTATAPAPPPPRLPRRPQ